LRRYNEGVVPGYWFITHRGVQMAGMVLVFAGLSFSLKRKAGDGLTKPFDWSSPTADAYLKAGAYTR
jgi:hypothetical protein